jgi:hypothetical protein
MLMTALLVDTGRRFVVQVCVEFWWAWLHTAPELNTMR